MHLVVFLFNECVGGDEDHHKERIYTREHRKWRTSLMKIQDDNLFFGSINGKKNRKNRFKMFSENEILRIRRTKIKQY